MAVLYSIGKKDSSIEERYIGVTSDYERRKKEHFKDLSKGIHPNNILQEAFDETFDMRVELFGEEEYCYEVEKTLRPHKRMGLNIAVGGFGGFRFDYYENPLSKHNRNGLMGNEFTSETASEAAKERSLKRELPAQVAKDTGNFGNMVFFTEENKKQTAERNSKLFKNTVTVTDREGNSKRISKEEFEKQKKGPRNMWKYVGNASKEAKQRRGEV